MDPKPDGIFGIIEIVRDFYDHGIDEHMIVFALMVVVALDIVLGVSRAWAYHEFSSPKMAERASQSYSYDFNCCSWLSVRVIHESWTRD